MKRTTPTLLHNRELADIFLRMSQCYSFLGPDDRFRANAYARASRALANLPDPVDVHAHSIRELDDLPGVGESIAGKIMEYLRTGKIATYEKLKVKVPTGLLDLLEIDGIGPSTIRLLHAQGINDHSALAESLVNGTLDDVRGLAGKKLDHLRQVLKVHKPEAGRMPLAQAWRTGQALLTVLKGVPGLDRLTLAGSLRRDSETVGDIDLVGVASEKDRKRIINHFVHIPNCQRILARGTTRASILLGKPHVQVDLRLVDASEYGSALLHFTGSKEHNIWLRTLAQQKGWKLNEYGVFDAAGKRLGGDTEESVYALFGLPFVPPQQRLGRHELDGAR